MTARREITKKFAGQYAKAGKADMGAVLDALVATTGWTRDHARRAIRVASQRRGPAPAERLTRFRELGKVADRATPQVLDEVRAMSAAPIDRYLKPHKDGAYPSALSGTKPSHILRSSIPTRTSTDEPIATAGFLELDTVPHSGRPRRSVACAGSDRPAHAGLIRT